MRVIVQDSARIIGYNQLASAIFRTDLIPVPANIELVLKLDDDLEKDLQIGSILLVGDEQIAFTIIKKTPLNTQIIVEDKRCKLLSIIAVLSGCENLLDHSNKAIILQNTSFSEAYRSSGCTLKFSKDLPLGSFCSAYGVIPTLEIASCLQQESALVYLDGKKLSVQRLTDFFAQDPSMRLDNGSIVWDQNPKVEQGQSKNYSSIAEDGSVIASEKPTKAPASYYPNLDARQLKNLKKILIRCGVAIRTLDLGIKAGDIVIVDQTKYIILTVAHLFKSGALGGGTSTASKLWLAKLSNV